jgi:hypothetical protein
MSETLDAYSIQYWLESCPQAYLVDTLYGHAPDAKEAEAVLSDPVIHDQALQVTVQMLVGERCALAASSGLINAAPDEASKRFLATQTLDEARHVEIFTQRLLDLGVKRSELEDVVAARANPNLGKFAEILLEKVDKKDFIAGVVGQNIILEGMAFSVFEMAEASNRDINPKFASTLSGTIADERRHVGFGENRIGSLVREHPERKPEIEQMQRDMSYVMLATFADQFRTPEFGEEVRRLRSQSKPNGASNWHGENLAELDASEMEQLLSRTVLAEFKSRLGRIGLEYQTPRAV